MHAVCFPALLRRIKLFDLVRDRPVGLISLWLAQGFGHPSARGLLERQKRVFPCAQILPSVPSPPTRGQKRDRAAASGFDMGPLSVLEQKSLLGNSMHILSVSSWFLFLLVTTLILG